VGELAGREREPRDEPDALLLGVLQQRLGVALDELVEVLDGRDGRDLLGRLRLLDADLREADVADLALVLQLLQLGDLVLQRDGGVDAVQLEEVDRLDPEVAQGQLRLLAQVRRHPDRRPDARALAGQAGLGRDDHVVGVRVQRLLEELLGDHGAVGVGGVEERHAELDRAPQHPHRLLVVLGRTPDPSPVSCMVP
jgi:hypothetical protein